MRIKPNASAVDLTEQPCGSRLPGVLLNTSPGQGRVHMPTMAGPVFPREEQPC